jgi:DNA-binding transcriptional MerR regulator/methylmalonyl-CoA mutase cobalamin-binding subunit
VFRIRHAAKLAGINPTLLRAWERRYHLVTPARTPSGYRVYSEQDVERLRAAARLCGAGHSISEVARLSPEQLTAAAAQLTASATSNAGADVMTAPIAPAMRAGDHDEAAPDPTTVTAAIGKALVAIAEFDRRGFEDALFPLTTLTGIGPVAQCEHVLLPLLRAIGDAWEHGRMTVAAEHFGSALCRAKILQYLEFVARSATGPRVVCACPENELHEGGLLAFAVRAAAERWQVIYLGGHTPVEQALESAARIAAEMVAMSLTVPRTTAEIERLLQQVREARQQRPGLRVVIGGREALAQRARLESAGIEVASHIAVSLAPPGKTVPA